MQLKAKRAAGWASLSTLVSPATYTIFVEKTEKHRRVHHWLLIAAMFVVAVTVVAQNGGQAPAASDLRPGSAPLIQPQDLLKALQSRSARPLVLYIGPRFLYVQLHIHGDEFIGPTSNPQGLDQLRKRVATLPKNSPVVLYCGCCPWDHCPNVRPAYNELQKMGYTGVKVLYLANSFGADWVDKRYPVEKGW